MASEEKLREAILSYRSTSDRDPEIGCIVLAAPFFFERKDWIEVPPDWSHGIQRGKTYRTDEPLGRHLWEQVQERLSKYAAQPPLLKPVQVQGKKPTVPPSAPIRIGHGAFSVLVTDAYRRTCTITGERALPVLRAVHIKPCRMSGPHEVANGLLLRADVQLLFEKGYVTVDPTFRIHVSRYIKQRYEESSVYSKLEGRTLVVLPSEPEWRPALEFLEWHNEKVFLG